jgi:branched-chain amino acid transport system ATP-binding protein
VLELQDVHTYYGDSYVLQGVTLRVPEGSAHALLGRNGMGKTTLIRTVVGMNPPRRGSIRYRSRELAGLPPYRIAALGIGLVPQGRRIFRSLSVLENLTLARRGPRRPGNRKPWDLEGVLGLFPRLKERLTSTGGQLSGGEQQMAAIARALMTNPDLLLLDEPSEGLAPLLVRQLQSVLAQLKASGLSIFLVEQNLGLALGVADTVAILANGQIVYEGSPAALSAAEDVKRLHLGV